MHHPPTNPVPPVTSTVSAMGDSILSAKKRSGCRRNAPALATRFDGRKPHAGTVPRGVIEVWEVLVRHRHVEEAADRLPAVARLVDEQSRSRNRIDDGLVVLREYALGV